MMILALDTSTSWLSLALWEKSKLLAASVTRPDRRQAEVILPEIEALFRQAGLTLGQLGGLAVGLGPGSFTGLRVGISIAQGMAQALGLPIAGVSSFMAAAAGSEAALALVVEDARREMVYAALYARQGEAWAPVWPEALLSLEEVRARMPSQPLAVTGPGAEHYYPALRQAAAADLSLIPAPMCFPQAAVIARLAGPMLAAGGMQPEMLRPLYIRRTQAEESLRPAW